MLYSPKKKYQKSKQGYRCLGPCYKKGDIQMHPITLQNIKINDYDFCFIRPTYDKDGKFIDHDQCKYQKDQTDKQTIDVFNCEDFLKTVYDIESYQMLLDWLYKNRNNPLATVMRVLNCMWDIYSDRTIDELVITYYEKIINQKWLNIIYLKLGEHIIVKDTKIWYDLKKTQSLEKHKDLKKEFIKYQLIDRDRINEILNSYVVFIKDKNVLDHNRAILHHLINFLKNNI